MREGSRVHNSEPKVRQEHWKLRMVGAGQGWRADSGWGPLTPAWGLSDGTALVTNS